MPLSGVRSLQIISRKGEKVLYRIPLSVRWTTLAAIFAIGIGGIGYGVNEALNGVYERQQVQLERCESGNELRRGLYDEKNEELKEVESHGVPYYEEFLNGTEAQLRELRQESITKIKERIDRYAPENCEKAVE